MDDSPAQLALTHYSRELWRDLQNTLPATVEFEECGTLWVAADDEEMQEVFAKRKAYASAGWTEVWTAGAAEAEPNLRPDWRERCCSRRCGDLSSGRGWILLESASDENEAHLWPTRDVGGEGRVMQDDTTRLMPDTSWSPPARMSASGHGSLCVGVRGTWRSPIDIPGLCAISLSNWLSQGAHSLTEDSVAFNVQPRKTGQVLIGSSRQYGDLSSQADPEMLRRMLERAVEYMPKLASLTVIRVWTGYRAATPDKLPLVGPTADSSVVLAMGFEGLGITNAPGVARLVLHHITKAEITLNPQPFLPSRVGAPEATYA